MSQFIDCVQTGASKLTHSHEEEGEWRMKAWRCDLTGLSQLHNLYFVACNDEILVYQPEFPDQTFAPEPKLILKPPATSPYLYPGIDEEDPHSITRILVESLGNEEILLGTCDDGDFFIYRIEAIRKALSATSSEEWPECGPEIPLFLHQNMGASAWGLAVHKEARMIAVSANTHEVRVLAFALASEDGEQLDSDSMDERIRDDETDPHPEDFPFPRKYDHHFTLEAKHNVPSVSFNNNDQDPAGRWLYGTCITGEVWLWDLHAPPLAPYRIFQMGFCASAQLANKAPQVLLGPCRCDNCLSHPHASWGAMFLDPRSAHKFPSMSGIPQSARCAPYFHDTGVQKERFRLLPTLSTALDNMTSDNTDSEMAVSDGGSNDSNEDSDMTDDASVDDADGSLNSHGGSYDNTDDMEEDDVQDQEHDEETYNEPSIPSMQLENPQPDAPAGPGTPAYMANLLASGTPWSILVQAMYGDGDDDDDEDDEGGEDHLSHAHNIFSLSNYARSRPSPKPYCEISDPGFPISESHQPSLIITKDDIFLLQRPFKSLPFDPILNMRRPIHIGSLNEPSTSSDRLCFSTQIPELGLFIIGSPIGRVAIFALTKSGETGDFGFQLEYILPFRKGDENEIVHPQADPKSRMVGVAVGPVQGELGDRMGMRDRRWRLMMYFTDHSMMSFELSRKREGGDVGLGELVV